MKTHLLFIFMLITGLILDAQTNTGPKMITDSPVDTLFIEKYIDVEHIDNLEDYRAMVEVSWGADSIYLKFTFWDDVIWDDGGADYMQDNIEIYFDMDNSKGENYDEVDDYQLRLVNDFYPWETTPNSNNDKVEGVRLIYTVTLDGNDTTGYTYDMAIPFESLKEGFTPETGTQIGFDVLASDNDGDPVYRDALSWNSVSYHLWDTPYYWGVLEFAPDGKVIPIWDTEAPTVPENFIASVDGNKIKLSWDPSLDNRWVKGNRILQDGVLIKEGYCGSQPTFTAKDLEPGTYEFSVTAYDIYDNESDAATIEATVEPDALELITKDRISVYPNPVRDQLTIAVNEELGNTLNITLFDITGKVIYSEQLVQAMSKQYTIDLSSFGEGIYFLHINNDQYSHTEKVIKVE